MGFLTVMCVCVMRGQEMFVQECLLLLLGRIFSLFFAF